MYADGHTLSFIRHFASSARFNKLTDRFFKTNAWPEADSVAAILEEEGEPYWTHSYFFLHSMSSSFS